jgi:hypothetical protein
MLIIELLPPLGVWTKGGCLLRRWERLRDPENARGAVGLDAVLVMNLIRGFYGWCTPAS